MDETVKRQRVCPSCKFEMEISFESRKLGTGVIKNCPRCDLPVLFCPDDYIVESIAPFIPISELEKTNRE